MNILLSRKLKLVIAVLFFVIAISVAIFELSTYLNSRHTQKDYTSVEHIAVQPGVIQHVITKLKPIVPSGKVLEINSESIKTIQSVIDSAKPGDTVLIKRGIYGESLNLKDGIILQGEDVNSVIIKGDMRIGPVLRIDNCKIVQVSKLTLQHFNQLADDDDFAGNWPIVLVNNSGAFLNNLIVCDSSAEGVKIQNDNVHLDHVSISDCTIYNNKLAGILVLGNGNVDLKNNTCINNKRNGICFKDFTDGVVTANVCKNNLYNGLSIQHNASVEIYGNTCAKNQYAGIVYASNSPFTVKDNNCFENGTNGILIDGQIALNASGNTCNRNAINGIYLMNSVSGSVNDNICLENKWHGISIEKTCVPHVDNNKCFKNTKCGIYDNGGMLGQNKSYDNGEFCTQEIQMHFRAEDFDELEKIASRIRNEKSRFANGNWQLDYFYNAFELRYDPTFERNIALAEKWVAQCPNSVTAKIALATSFYWQGWIIRGSGFSKTVSPAAWKPFEDYLSKALDTLKQAEKLNDKDPGLYTNWIVVAIGLGNLDDIESAFQKGIAIEPTYTPLYYSHGFAYLTKWYGKQGQYENLAAAAADSTKDQAGDSLYFLLSLAMTKQVKDINEFKESGFDYNRIKQGQKDFAKQFPNSIDIEASNRLCFMACAAGDKESARDYFLDIDNQWNEKLWRDYKNFEKYKTWARNRDH